MFRNYSFSCVGIDIVKAYKQHVTFKLHSIYFAECPSCVDKETDPVLGN